jgi:hypothetical protein
VLTHDDGAAHLDDADLAAFSTESGVVLMRADLDLATLVARSESYSMPAEPRDATSFDPRRAP